MGSLFTPEPEQWGLRGDPYLWRALREALDETSIPSTDEGVDNLLFDRIKDMTGVDLRQDCRRPCIARSSRTEECRAGRFMFRPGGIDSSLY